MAMKVSYNKHYNIGRVVKRVVYTVIWLWVGGDIINIIGTVVNGTESAFYKGLSLIGWTVGAYPTNGTHFAATCGGTTFTETASLGNSCVTNPTGDGVLAVVGVLAMASVVLEFIVISKQ